MIFVDTGAWIALTDRKDQKYGKAVAIFNRLRQQKERLLTTDYIVDETVTRLRYDLNHSVGVKFLELVEQAEKTGVLTLIRIDEKLFEEAKSLFRTYDSAILSFTDCTSFAVCQMLNLNAAVAFDQHFPMMGISLLS